MTISSTSNHRSRGKKKKLKKCNSYIFGSDITQRQRLNKKYKWNIFSNFNNQNQLTPITENVPAEKPGSLPYISTIPNTPVTGRFLSPGKQAAFAKGEELGWSERLNS